MKADDDPLIHSLWKLRIEKTPLDKRPSEAHFYTSADKLRKRMELEPFTRDTNYFFDFNLGQVQESGLDLIWDLGLASRACLVTGQFEDPAIIARAKTTPWEEKARGDQTVRSLEITPNYPTPIFL